MSFLYYLLETNLYLLLFYGFYRLLLHKETFYTLNRYYLIVSTIAAFILPLMQASHFNAAEQAVIQNAAFPPPELLVEKPVANASIAPAITFTDALPYIYALIVGAFMVKLVFSIGAVLNIIFRSKRARAGNITYINLQKPSESAFSFFNVLFINPSLEEKQTVISHELVHIRQRHSLDIIFFELIQAICWFNPIAYLLKSDIKLIHEYLADEHTTSFGNNKHEYAMFLIRNSFGIPTSPITNHIFNQSILKRRINMLNKKRTTSRARYRLLLLLPLCGTMLCLGTMAFTKDYGMIDLYPEKYSKSAMVQVTPPSPVESVDYFAASTTDPVTKKRISAEKRLVVINGTIRDSKNIAAVLGADKMINLKADAAIKKYGDKGKYGAIEFTGKKITISSSFTPPPPKQNIVRFPPPVVKPDKNNVYFSRTFNKETKQYTITDKRLFVDETGKPIDIKSRFGADAIGIGGLSNVVYLNTQQAQKKYGDNGKYGAVELTGSEMKALAKFPPPIVKPDVKRFPPPVVKPDPGVFITKWRYNKETKKLVVMEERLVVINGEPVKDLSNFGGVRNAEKITYLNAKEATAKYGASGKKGAVEINGTDIKILEPIAPPPPSVEPPPPHKTSWIKTGSEDNLAKVYTVKLSKDKRLEYTSDSTVLNKNMGIVSLYGNAEIKVDGREFSGRQITYNFKTGNLTILAPKATF